MDFSVVVICYNQPKNIPLILESFKLQQFDYDKFEVIIIDDGSSPPLDTSRYSNYPFCVNYKYVERTEDSCRAKARNVGAAMAAGEFIIFIDGDSLVNPELILKYDKYFQVHRTREVVLGTRKAVAYDRVPQIVSLLVDNDAFAASFATHGITDERLIFLSKADRPLSGIDGHWALFISCNFCIRRATYVKVGGFNEVFKGWGSEDTELGYRLSKLPVKIDLLDNPIFHIQLLNKTTTYAHRYRDWMKNIGVFYSLHDDETILFLMKFENLIYNTFQKGQYWSSDQYVDSIREFSERCRIFLDV